MNAKTAAVLLSALLAACAQSQPPATTAPPAPSPAPASAQAQPPAPATKAPVPAANPMPVSHVVNIQGAGCQQFLKLAPDDRQNASMFYLGYQASHFRARTINVSVVPSIVDQALVYCQENPNWTVARAFAEAYSREPGK